MKILPERKALETLNEIRTNYAAVIRSDYEHRAKSCVTCDTPGACCLDEHFVNVHISRLEAVAICDVIEKLEPEKRVQIAERVDAAIQKYGLSGSDGNLNTFACPLYEKGSGCLVHAEAKPLPCIQHACYETAGDLPPDELLDAAETAVDVLNRRVYRSPQPFLPLPVAIKRFTPTD